MRVQGEKPPIIETIASIKRVGGQRISLSSGAKNEWEVTFRDIGFLGKHKGELVETLNKNYGTGNWRFAWQVEEKFLPYENIVINHYEESYYQYLLKNPEIVDYLVTHARDVYDNAITNIHSGTDYNIQESSRGTHIQDIAIRKAMQRLGKTFQGTNLIEIRPTSQDPIGRQLSPEVILFHRPELIIQSGLQGWWLNDDGNTINSVEMFYQNNRVIQVKTNLLS